MNRPVIKKPSPTLIAHEILNGSRACPENLKVSDTCQHNHGLDGKTVRYKAGGHCIYCERTRNSKLKKSKYGESVAVKADRLRDDLEMQRLLEGEDLYI